MQHNICLSLGSNLGNRELNLLQAIELLKSEFLQVQTQSEFYENEPVDCPLNSPDFINMILLAKTSLKPKELLDYCQNIEKKLGQIKKKITNEARIIDIDIVTYDNLSYKDNSLIIPHERCHLRKFVLEPLAQIAPNWQIYDKSCTFWLKKL